MDDIFDEETYYTGPPLDLEAIHRLEKSLGYRLPGRYVELLLRRNGGSLRHRCLPTSFPNSWSVDHIEVRAILGIGSPLGIQSSASLIADWEYPAIGLVFCETPSGGHDTVMLDYSESGNWGEPHVAYVDEDRIPRRVANSFDDFINSLVPCDRFG